MLLTHLIKLTAKMIGTVGITGEGMIETDAIGTIGTGAIETRGTGATEKKKREKKGEMRGKESAERVIAIGTVTGVTKIPKYARKKRSCKVLR